MAYDRYARFQDQFESLAGRRPIYDAQYVDPYARTRVGQSTRRQEDWRDILEHGERSDTDWRAAAKDNLKVLRDEYTPGTTSFSASKGSMTGGVRSLYKATYGYELKMRQAANIKSRFAGTRSTDDLTGEYSDFLSARYDPETGQRRADAPTDERLFGKMRRFERAASDQAKLTRAAVQERDEATAKWMAEFNKQTNQAERIAKSQSRTKLAGRFEQLQIQRKSREARRTRGVKARGATGLVSGAGTGLGIPL